MLILRREFFGGILVDPSTDGPQILDREQYRQHRDRLEARRARGEPVRLVDVTEQGYSLRPDALGSPADAFLELTTRCNGACIHCYAAAGAASPEEIGFDDLARLLADLAKLGAYAVRLTGGEPTLREDFFDVIDVILEEGMTLAVNTNGLMSEAILHGILKRGVGDLRISLDGPEEVNDAIRGPGSYQRVLATLRAVAEYSRGAKRPADPTINMVLMQANRHFLRPMVELAAELGFKLSIGLLRPTGRAELHQMLSPEQVVACAREIQELRLPGRRIRANYDVFGPDYCLPGQRPFPLDNSTCAIGARGIGVTDQGRLVPCNYLAGVENGRWLGEYVQGADLLRLWHESKVLNEARQVRRRGCTGCAHHVRRCNGGCPATAYVVHHDLDGPDPYCVRHLTQ